MRMETVRSLKLHLLTAVTVSNVTVPQTCFLQCGPMKENLAMGNGALILYYVFIGHV